MRDDLVTSATCKGSWRLRGGNSETELAFFWRLIKVCLNLIFAASQVSCC